MAGVWYWWTAATSDFTSSATPTMWHHWCETGTSASTSTTSGVVWAEWAGTAATTSVRRLVPYIAPVLSAEEVERLRVAGAERVAKWKAEEAERQKKAKEANERAEQLLHQHLSGHQRRQYRRDRSFIVKAHDGHNYRVRPAWAGHVDRLDEKGRAVERFCIHPKESVPVPDNQLIAKLMLETEPDRFRKIANVTQLVGAN